MGKQKTGLSRFIDKIQQSSTIDIRPFRGADNDTAHVPVFANQGKYIQ
jgi:hypothetical protein